MAPRLRIVSQTSQEELPATDAPESAVAKPLVESSSFTAPTSQEIDTAREQHDIFNIVALLFVIASTMVNWDIPKLLHGPSQAFIGNFFYLNWLTTICYFVLDLLWVSSIPFCVKSPGTIIKHHFVAIAYLSAPLSWPEYRWLMGACLTVEINTWFLILRRVVYSRKNRIDPLVRQVVSMCFYVSWIAIRVIAYPMIMYKFCIMAQEKIYESGIFFHWPMIFIPVHFFLCILNLKWSYDLFTPIFKKLLGPQEQETVIASGL